jgi:hypothetical protein
LVIGYVFFAASGNTGCKGAKKSFVPTEERRG